MLKKGQRNRISESLRQLWKNPEYRKHMSQVHKGQISAMKGKKHSKESLQKMSEVMKKKYASGWNPNKGKKWSEEAKRKMSIAQKKRTSASDYVAPNKGKKFSSESRHKMSIGQKKRYADGGTHCRRGKKFPGSSNSGSFKKGNMPHNKGKKLSEELRQKLSESAKKRYAGGYEAPMKGRKLTKEHIQKMSETKKKLFASGILVSPNKGKKWSEEAKRKMSIAQKKRTSASDYVAPNKEKKPQKN